MDKNIHYASHKDYLVSYDEATFTMTMLHEPTQSRISLVFEGLYENGKKVFGMEEYDSVRTKVVITGTYHELSVSFITGKTMSNGELHVYVDPKGITLAVYEIGHYTLQAKGLITHGDSRDCIAINAKDTSTEAIRGAIGPAVSVNDNAIYNTTTDSAFVIDGCKDLRLFYDWHAEQYGVLLQTITEGRAEKIHFGVEKDLLGKKYSIDFAPRKTRGIYRTPPAGWMTWYAMKFDGCEDAVLRNVRFQEAHLKAFGADTVWVDWEWCHQRYERERFDGVNHFNPDPQKYPHGLGAVAGEIRKAGFVPGLWIGCTNDVGLTNYEKAHPEISLAHQETWCGSYYYDMTHPEYLNGFLPKVLEQVKAWGYQAVKYDTLHDGIEAHEKYHADMFLPEITTYRAYREMIRKTRAVLGEDCYLLSCGGSEEVTLWGCGVFDAVRVGPDLFEWEGFLTNLDRVRRYYPMHNIVQYNDSDNVVLREAFSNPEQAASRVVLISLLGLPLTFGDDLPELPDDRVELLKRALPTMDVHPADFNNAVSDGKTQVLTLNIALPFEQYLVAGVMNLTAESAVRNVRFKELLGLEAGEYCVYDYLRQEFLGVHRDEITAALRPFETRVLCLRRKTGLPQIVSTSRHFTQGAAELRDVHWEPETNTLCVTAGLVKGDPYTMTLLVPEEYRFLASSSGDSSIDGRVLTVRVLPDDSHLHSLRLSFEK